MRSRIIARTVGACVLTLAAAVTLLWKSRGHTAPLPVWVALGGGFVFLTVTSIVWSVLATRRFRWRLTTRAIETRSGVLGEHLRLVPLDRWQHVDCDIGPIQRGFGLATVKIHTAAGHGVLEIDDVTLAEAEGIRGYFLEERRLHARI